MWLWPTRVHLEADLAGAAAMIVLIVLGVMPWWVLAVAVAIALVARAVWWWRDGMASRSS